MGWRVKQWGASQFKLQNPEMRGASNLKKAGVQGKPESEHLQITDVD